MNLIKIVALSNLPFYAGLNDGLEAGAVYPEASPDSLRDLLTPVDGVHVVLRDGSIRFLAESAGFRWVVMYAFAIVGSTVARFDSAEDRETVRAEGIDLTFVDPEEAVGRVAAGASYATWNDRYRRFESLGGRLDEIAALNAYVGARVLLIDVARSYAERAELVFRIMTERGGAPSLSEWLETWNDAAPTSRLIRSGDHWTSRAWVNLTFRLDYSDREDVAAGMLFGLGKRAS